MQKNHLEVGEMILLLLLMMEMRMMEIHTCGKPIVWQILWQIIIEDINISKIYLDNYLQESTPGGPRSEATQNAINNRVDKGALLINYTGHGGPLGWTQERILELDQINAWDNGNKLPLFMTATCKFSYFDNPEQTSAGEYVIIKP